jgi:hypothetical protein
MRALSRLLGRWTQSEAFGRSLAEEGETAPMVQCPGARFSRALQPSHGGVNRSPSRRREWGRQQEWFASLAECPLREATQRPF